MKKFLKWSLLILVMLLAFPVIYFFVCDIYFKGSTNHDHVIYLKNNSVQVDIESLNLPADFLSAPDPKSSNVYLLGEFHGFSPTHLFDAAFFEYLNQHFGVKDYCSEFFTQDADSLNLFLSKEKPDSSIVYRVIRNISRRNIPQWNHEEYFQKWMRLYHYNRTLPDSARIRIHGLLGDEKEFNGGRDSIMADNLIHLKDEGIISQNVYCITGMAHALQGRFVNTMKPFSLRLKDAGFHTISIIQHATQSMMFVPEGIYPMTPPNEEADFFNSDGWLYYFSHIKDLKVASENAKVTLFKLNGKETPYNRCHDFVDSHGPLFFTNWYFTPVEGCVTTDYFQYVLFINGAASPRKVNLVD